MRYLRRGVVVMLSTLVMTLSLIGLTATSASAAWTTIINNGQVAFLVCKTAVSSPFGPLWKLTVVLTSTPDWQGSGRFVVKRGGQVVQDISLHSANGVWDVQTTYASRWYADTWSTASSSGQISTGQGSGSGLGDVFRPVATTIGSC